ncbi:hypothetical protein [Paenibacillus nasutitermitis]|uniref:Uncharacterized protein n=1 Tax=Paenibacillus nasutitermitis TaxID=1652958 RepID=A0A916YJQ7_9BACL|nr:hypothetical protein [Paenibacillus nasutitermitis]GGD46975.1 hypothetical protein GCM10010911_00610 [Paenibacillus nasutitermitis]
MTPGARMRHVADAAVLSDNDILAKLENGGEEMKTWLRKYNLRTGATEDLWTAGCAADRLHH